MLERVFDGSAARLIMQALASTETSPRKWRTFASCSTNTGEGADGSAVQAWMHMIGSTLIHFVWQGGLLAVADGHGSAVVPARSSAARYAIACAADSDARGARDYRRAGAPPSVTLAG